MNDPKSQTEVIIKKLYIFLIIIMVKLLKKSFLALFSYSCPPPPLLSPRRRGRRFPITDSLESCREVKWAHYVRVCVCVHVGF